MRVAHRISLWATLIEYGDNAKGAYDDAVEQLAHLGFDVKPLPRNPKGITKRDTRCLKEKNTETYFYVSIRVM